MPARKRPGIIGDIAFVGVIALIFAGSIIAAWFG